MAKRKGLWKAVFTPKITASLVSLVAAIVGQTVKEKVARAVIVGTLAGVGSYTGYEPLQSEIPALLQPAPPSPQK